MLNNSTDTISFRKQEKYFQLQTISPNTETDYFNDGIPLPQSHRSSSALSNSNQRQKHRSSLGLNLRGLMKIYNPLAGLLFASLATHWESLKCFQRFTLSLNFYFLSRDSQESTSTLPLPDSNSNYVQTKTNTAPCKFLKKSEETDIHRAKNIFTRRNSKVR